MLKHIVWRPPVSLVVLWGVSTLVFGMMHALPGDPVELMVSRSGGSAETIASIRQQLGLDLPLFAQYVRFLGNALHGDLGRSISTGMKVTDMIASQFPATLELASAQLSRPGCAAADAGVGRNAGKSPVVASHSMPCCWARP